MASLEKKTLTVQKDDMVLKCLLFSGKCVSNSMWSGTFLHKPICGVYPMMSCSESKLFLEHIATLRVSLIDMCLIMYFAYNGHQTITRAKWTGATCWTSGFSPHQCIQFAEKIFWRMLLDNFKGPFVYVMFWLCIRIDRYVLIMYTLVCADGDHFENISY